jgi:hypothetical protein
MNPKNLWPIIVLCTLCPLASRAAEQNETVPREYQGFAEVTKYRGVIDDPDGPLGAVCDPTDPAAIAAAIRSILELDPAAGADLRARCAHAARERYTWEHEVAALLRLYRDLAQTARAGSPQSPAPAPS